MPSRSVTPGRKPSSSTSARSTSASTSSTPAGSLRSTATERRPRLSRSCSAAPVGGRARGRSIRSTSAPRSASSIAANGPGPIPASSTTRSPARGPVVMAGPDRTGGPAVKQARRCGQGSGRRDGGVPPGGGDHQRDHRTEHGSAGAGGEQHPVGGQRRQREGAQGDRRRGEDRAADRAGQRAADAAGQRFLASRRGELGGGGTAAYEAGHRGVGDPGAGAGDRRPDDDLS